MAVTETTRYAASEDLTRAYVSRSRQQTEILLYHSYTIWLFTRSDLKTIVGPSTFFAIVCALSGPMIKNEPFPSILLITSRIPVTAFWAWINLLPFAIENQRQQESITEDLENKPWRPLPSKRLSTNQATSWMLSFYLLAFLSSICLGGTWQCVTLIGLGYWYNDLKGSDTSCVIRNFINGCGYICFTSGALEVILNCSVSHLNPAAHQWLFITGMIVFTTIQSQDMSDQAGDSLRKRRTVPLVIGDWAARLTIAISMAAWSIWCPRFWQIGFEGSIAPVILGSIVIGRFLWKRKAEEDIISFRIYNLWIVSLYFLPLIKRLGEGERFSSVE